MKNLRSVDYLVAIALFAASACTPVLALGVRGFGNLLATVRYDREQGGDPGPGPLLATTVATDGTSTGDIASENEPLSTGPAPVVTDEGSDPEPSGEDAGSANDGVAGDPETIDDADREPESDIREATRLRDPEMGQLLDATGTASTAAAARQTSPPDTPGTNTTSSTVNLPTAGTWNETATKLFYNGDIKLEWREILGDHAASRLATIEVPDRNTRYTLSIPVSGNDFYIENDGGGSAIFDARNGPTGYRPTLIVNGKTTYTATRDVALLYATTTSRGTEKLLNDRDAMLIAFDKYNPLPGDKAVLKLVTEQQYGTHRLSIYRPDIRSDFPVIESGPAGSTVQDIRAQDFRTSATVSIANDVVTGYWGDKRGTAISQLFKLPPADEYYLTVLVKLEKDWPNQAGKLPGLSNTGQGTNSQNRPLTIDGVKCDNSGWGGRPANGCRWSARTGWGGRSGDFVGLHTYFYAKSPASTWGVIQNWPTPAPVGKWFAYVERVKLNTPGQGDGRLSYWLCTPEGCAPQFDRKDIAWRSADLPETQISEAWADIYCGGIGCPGPNPWPVSTANLKRMTVTTGLPDLAGLLAELRTMNAQ